MVTSVDLELLRKFICASAPGGAEAVGANFESFAQDARRIVYNFWGFFKKELQEGSEEKAAWVNGIMLGIFLAAATTLEGVKEDLFRDYIDLPLPDNVIKFDPSRRKQ